MSYQVDMSNFPSDFMKSFNKLSPEAQQRWRDERYKALTDHLYLSTELMDMDFQQTPHKWLFEKMLKKDPGTPLYDLDKIKKKRMLLWSRGLFKALDLDTLIPTPTGFKRMGDMEVGDKVLGSNGTPCNVTGTSPVYLDRPCYEVEFSTGEKIVADEEHLWLTDARTDKEPSVKTTKQIADTIGHNKRGWFEANHSVMVASALDLPDVCLPIHPYELGCLLRYGTFNKGIPINYLRASYNQRLELLQGIIDTDGSISKKRGIVSFNNTNKQLTEDVRQLVASLGFKPYRIKQYKTLYGFHYAASDTCNNYRQIVAVRPVESRPVKCIMVDSPDHLYLVGEGFIPTHNTSAVVVEIVQLILNYPDIRICFMSGADSLAKLQLQRVKRYFEAPTKKFESLFPEFCGKKLGTQSAFTVPCRVGHTFAEPTLKISTSRSVKASQHFDVIFVDDLVNDSNYKSIKLLQGCTQSYKDICPLLAPDGFMYVTGTRYSFGDLYEDIQELAMQEIKELGTNPWIFSIKSCWVKVCKCGHKDIEHDFDTNLVDHPCAECRCPAFEDSGATSVLFPKFRCKDGRTEGHSVEFLQSEKIRLGAEFFGCQYENNPISVGEQTFDEDLIGRQTVWHPNQFPSDMEASCFVMGDLSYVGDENRDLSVLFVVRYYAGQLYVVDCSYGSWDAWETAQELFKITMKHRPTIIWLERFLGWGAYDTVFSIFARDNNITKFPVEWKKISNAGGAKKVRIGAIKGVMAQKRLWIFGHIPGYEQLTTQLIRWPKLGKHDDFADCLGMVCEAPTGMELDNLPTARKDSLSSLSFIRNINRSRVEEEYYDSRIPGTY